MVKTMLPLGLAALAVWLIWLAPVSHAQAPLPLHPPLKDFIWECREFQPPLDLPHPHVRDIQAGLTGEVWFATWGGGVARHDGYESVVYNESKGMLSNYTRSLAVDRQGGAWVCTSEGMNYIQPDGVIHPFNATDFPNLRSRSFHAAVIDAEGRVWCGTGDGQIYTCERRETDAGFPYDPWVEFDLGVSPPGVIEEIVIDRQ